MFWKVWHSLKSKMENQYCTIQPERSFTPVVSPFECITAAFVCFGAASECF